MKIFFFFLLLLSSLISAEVYKKIKINIYSPEKMREIASLGIPLEESYYNHNDNSLSLFVSATEIKKLDNASIKYEVLIDNWDEYFLSQPKMSSVQKSNSLQKLKTENNVSGFGYGSLAGFYTLEEVYNKLDTLHLQYPQIVSEKFQIGTSYEGRPLYAVKISDNYNQDEDEPEVFYNAMIHAREPEAMMTVMYFMFYLAENYNVDEIVTYLVNNRELYFVPVINVDGYEYNRLIKPQGGGMWRKNRNGYGIDLNRNFGFEWGHDDYGSSPDSTDDTFRGNSAFSEPETRAIRDFCIGKNFNVALNYHTYGNDLIYPWGYIKKETPDSIIFRDFSGDMTKYNGYKFGTVEQVLYYSTNGDADDWMYGEQDNKRKIISMTPEVGTEGFWPPMGRILPIAQDNIYPNLYLAWIAGSFVKAISITMNKDNYLPGETANVNLKFKNKGFLSAENISVTISMLDGNKIIPDTTFSISKIDKWMELEIKGITINTNRSGPTNIIAEVYSGNVKMSADTFFIPTGEIVYVFNDPAENIDSLWDLSGTSKWVVDRVVYYGSPSSFTNSAVKPYNNNDNSSITLRNSLDLSEAVDPILTFNTLFSMEQDFDYGRVKVSKDGGLTWKSVGGKYSSENPWATDGQKYYTGYLIDWVKEEIDLSGYKSNNFLLRFEFHSDDTQTFNGWNIDNIKIYYRNFSPVNVDKHDLTTMEFLLSQNYPNPFNPTTNLEFRIPDFGPRDHRTSFVSLKVYDILGNEVATLINDYKPAGVYKIEFDGSKLSSGIYFYTLNAGGRSITKKMCLLK